MMNTAADTTTTSGPSFYPGVAPSSSPIVGNPAKEARRLALNERLEAVLRGTANAYGAAAAEFWTLNSSSIQLNGRVIWGKSNRTTEKMKPRLLASSDADVAALAGGVVALEHPAELLQWHCHRSASSAVCLPVASDTTIHGTLWLFFDREKSFSNRELEMLEIVAGRLAVEVEREALLHQSDDVNPVAAKSNAKNSAKDNTNNKSATHAETPSQLIASEELEISNWKHPEQLGNESLWSVMPNGNTLAMSTSIIATPGTTEEQAAKAIEHTNRIAHELAKEATDSGELLTELNRRLFGETNLNVGVTLAIALLDSEGLGTIATAGPSLFLQVRASMQKSNIGESIPLAWDVEARYESTRVELNVRERLLLVTGTPNLSNPILERQFFDTFRAPTADAHRAMSAKECVERLLRTRSEELGAITAIRRV